jgi:dienelactone hydrolase
MRDKNGVERLKMGSDGAGNFVFVLKNSFGGDSLSLSSGGNAVFSGDVKTDKNAEIGNILYIGKNDESEGEGVGGFPQGVVDLDHAISFVEESGSFPDLPIGLFGHSWGGYSVCSVLTYHPEVKAVIECCGCNRSTDLFELGGKAMAGDAIYTMMPFVRFHEWTRYGKYATNTAMDGFEASETPVMVAHSEDDEVVPVQYGYNLYYEKYKDDPRFVFLHFEDKGHNDFFIDSNDTYRDEFDAEFDKWFETLGYDRKADENKE